MKPIIATIGSHSALQILKGAKQENFTTALICKKKSEKVYRSFNIADKIYTVDDFNEIFDEKFNELREKAIFIPHGSFIEYLSKDKIFESDIKIFGNKKIFEWEGNRLKMFDWLKKSNIRTPKIFKNPSEINKLCIIKFHGAKGGKGYFLVENEEEFYKKQKEKKFNIEDCIIQEYIIGTRFYPHFFYSNITKKLEIFGVDLRYESNADGIVRLPPKFANNIDLSYVVVGNIPVIMRESLLEDVYEMGENLINSSEKLFNGLWGPFCLETILTDDMKFYTIEVSARIVAGTNLYVNGSSYTHILYDEPMSMGRRIAREIKIAIEKKMLNKVIT